MPTKIGVVESVRGTVAERGRGCPVANRGQTLASRSGVLAGAVVGVFVGLQAFIPVVVEAASGPNIGLATRGTIGLLPYLAAVAAILGMGGALMRAGRV